MSIGNRIEYMRLTNGWTQKELGTRAKIKQPIISMYESRRRVPSNNDILALAEALDTSVAYLLYGNETLDIEQEIIVMYTSLLSDEDKGHVLSYLKFLSQSSRP